MSKSIFETEEFRQRVKFLRESQWWPRERLESYQRQQLRELMSHVYERVPYYREVMKERCLSPKDFDQLEDIRQMPLVTKAIIQEHSKEFLHEGIDPETLERRSTGGSTGTPLTIYMDQLHIARDKANTEFYMNVAGLDIFSHKSVRLYGDKIAPDILQREQYWYTVDDRKLVMSCYHINRDTVPLYVAELNRFQPKYIHSRPSAIYPLARLILELDLKPDFSLAGIFLDGEMLPDSQRELLEKAFKCRVFMIYGHTEGCAVGLSCSTSRDLHFMPQVGILEILDDNGKQVTSEGERGEMVVTGFNNRVFPLIRYRTFDYGVVSTRDCGCGREFPMLERVEGRLQDYAIARDGERVPLAPAVFNYNDMDWQGIRQFQVQQTEPGRLLFKLLREPTAHESEAAMQARVMPALQTILGSGFEVSLKFVEKLPRTRIGKFRYLDQHLELSDFPSTI